MRTMRIRRWSWLLVVPLAAGMSVAGTGEQGERQTAKERKPGSATSEKREEPVSPIYQAAQRGEAGGDRAVVYTNEELERMWQNLSPEDRRRGVYQAERHIGQAEPSAEAEPPVGEEGTPTATPLEALQQERAATAARRQQIEEARKRVADLEQQVSDLERAKQAIRNPLLPKSWRKPTAEGEEQADQEWDDLDNTQRLEQTEQRLEEARKKLEAARDDLDRLRRS